MIYVALVTLIALFTYLVITVLVGKARERTGVKLPAVTGNEEFERYYRVQMNTLEQMIVFLPALWLCSLHFSPMLGTALGSGWIIGRILYAAGYYQATEKRLPGFFLSMFCTLGLLLGALWGVGVRLLVN